MNQIHKNMADQIGAKELQFAKFKLMLDGENGMIVKKGQKFMVINYNYELDLYDVRLGKYNKQFEIKEEKMEGVYNDMLRELLQNHFKFEYVMDAFMAQRRK